MTDVSIVLFANNGAVSLQDAMRNLRDTLPGGCQIVVMARECREDVATYLTRQCLKGHIAGFGFDPQGIGRSHCGMDGAFYLTDGQLLVRVQDDLRFSPGWLEKVTETLEQHQDIGCLGLLPPRQQRRRGRPPKPRSEAEIAESVDLALLRDPARRLPRARAPDAQRAHRVGLPLPEAPQGDGHAARLSSRTGHGGLDAGGRPDDALAIPEGGLPVHGGPLGAMKRIQQVYRVADDVVLTCMSCGNTELEVLSAQVEFCPDDVPVGYSYTMRCHECRESTTRRMCSSNAPGKASGRPSSGRRGTPRRAAAVGERRGAGGRLSPVRLQPGLALRHHRLGAQHLGRRGDPRRGRRRAQVDAFAAALPREAPPRSFIASLERSPAVPTGDAAFVILESAVDPDGLPARLARHRDL